MGHRVHCRGTIHSVPIHLTSISFPRSGPRRRYHSRRLMSQRPASRSYRSASCATPRHGPPRRSFWSTRLWSTASAHTEALWRIDSWRNPRLWICCVWSAMRLRSGPRSGEQTTHKCRMTSKSDRTLGLLHDDNTKPDDFVKKRPNITVFVILP